MSLDSTATPLPVVCALIERDGALLLAQRPAHKHLGGKWEFPGGKIEPGETPPAALAREINEELGCAITIVRPLPSCTHDYPTVRIELIPFVCALSPESLHPIAHEHTAIAWIPPRDLLVQDLAPADIRIAESYLRSLP